MGLNNRTFAFERRFRTKLTHPGIHVTYYRSVVNPSTFYIICRPQRATGVSVAPFYWIVVLVALAYPQNASHRVFRLMRNAENWARVPAQQQVNLHAFSRIFTPHGNRRVTSFALL
jgi:hypothetical protein